MERRLHPSKRNRITHSGFDKVRQCLPLPEHGLEVSPQLGFDADLGNDCSFHGVIVLRTQYIRNSPSLCLDVYVAVTPSLNALFDLSRDMVLRMAMAEMLVESWRQQMRLRPAIDRFERTLPFTVSGAMSETSRS